jgi:hypothetical protein
LQDYFSKATAKGQISENSLGELVRNASIKHHSNASCAARVIAQMPEAKMQASIKDFIGRIKTADVVNQVSGALCLGELGKLKDLSK